MKVMSALESAVFVTDYREQAEKIRAGERGAGFAYSHGRTVGRMLRLSLPTFSQALGIRIQDIPSLAKKYPHNSLCVNEWAGIDFALEDIRRTWPVTDRASMFLAVLLHGGIVARTLQSVKAAGAYAHNARMAATDAAIQNTAQRVSRSISRRRKNG